MNEKQKQSNKITPPGKKCFFYIKVNNNVKPRKNQLHKFRYLMKSMNNVLNLNKLELKGYFLVLGDASTPMEKIDT